MPPPRRHARVCVTVRQVPHTWGMRLAIATVFLAMLAACAAPASPAERERINAEKQEALKDMLEKGQRN
jgi:Leu/Phe-tRNA-protein transferase